MTKSEPTTVFSGSLSDAGTVKGLLESHGLRAHLKNEVVGGLLPQIIASGGMGAVEVLVASQDARKARDLIRVYHEGRGRISPDAEASLGKRALVPNLERTAPLKWLDKPTVILILGIAAAVAARSFYLDHYVKYFRHLRTDGRHEFVGAYPVSSDFAKRTGTYRFVYNLQGKPKAIEYRMRGKLDFDDLLCAARVEIKYGKNSETRVFENEKGEPTYCRGVHLMLLELDDERHVGALSNRDEDSDRPVEDKYGVAKALFELDGAGRIARSTRADLRGVKITDGAGRCSVGYSYDPGGNMIERVNRGLDGKLLEDKSGVAATRWRYDARGGVVETQYFDAHDRLIRNAGKNWSSAGVAVVRGKHNALGDAIETNFFDADGRLKENAVGVTTILSNIDANGNTVEKKYLGADGKPRAAKGSGAAVFQWEYDEGGRITAEKTFDAHGRLVEEHHYVPQLDNGNQYSNFSESARF